MDEPPPKLPVAQPALWLVTPEGNPLATFSIPSHTPDDNPWAWQELANVIDMVRVDYLKRRAQPLDFSPKPTT